MIGKYFEGVVPDACDPEGKDLGATHPTFDSFTELLYPIVGAFMLSFADYRLAKADTGLLLVGAVDTYIEERAPFKLAKDPDKLPEVGTILYNCVEALRIASVLLWPFIPDKCEQFWSRIGFGHYAEQLKDGGRGDLEAWVKWGQLVPGTPIEKGEALFPRYQVEKK